jgi:SAM-dependent methyltransferase
MEPSGWLTGNRHLLPVGGDALDVPCGRGRHALWLAAQGFAVRAVDRDAEAIHSLQAAARELGLQVAADVLDLEHGDPGLGVDRYDLVVVISYLYRPLFPALLAALRPGGVLVYETFTRDQALVGKPTSPAFLLEPGELARLMAPLEVVAQREGRYDGRFVASSVGRKLPRRDRS